LCIVLSDARPSSGASIASGFTPRSTRRQPLSPLFLFFRLCAFVVRFVPLWALFEALFTWSPSGRQPLSPLFFTFFTAALALPTLASLAGSNICAIYYRKMQRPATSFYHFSGALEMVQKMQGGVKDA